MKKENDDFMGKVKEFFKLTKGKIWVFGILLFLLFAYLTLFGRLACSGTDCTSWTIGTIYHYVIIPADNSLFEQIFPNEFGIALLIIDIIYLYVLSCFINFIICKLKKL